MEAINSSKTINIDESTTEKFIRVSIIHFSNEIRTGLTHNQFTKIVSLYRNGSDLVMEFEKLIHLSLDSSQYRENYDKFMRLYIENDIYYDLEFNYAIQPLLMFYTYLYTKNRIKLEPDIYVARLIKVTQAYRYSKTIDPVKLTKFVTKTLLKH